MTEAQKKRFAALAKKTAAYHQELQGMKDKFVVDHKDTKITEVQLRMVDTTFMITKLASLEMAVLHFGGLVSELHEKLAGTKPKNPIQNSKASGEERPN